MELLFVSRCAEKPVSEVVLCESEGSVGVDMYAGQTSLYEVSLNLSVEGGTTYKEARLERTDVPLMNGLCKLSLSVCFDSWPARLFSSQSCAGSWLVIGCRVSDKG